MNRDQAWDLLNEYVQSPSLIMHCQAVEACMRHYAARHCADPDVWGIVGLLHDFDYERWPEPPEHTREGARVLRDRSVDEEIVGCILSHADWNLDDYPRNTDMRKVLFAVDELAGFIVAVARVRPDKLDGLKPSSVKKKLKQKSFAAAVNRHDIQQGAALLELPLDEHIAQCIDALMPIAGELNLSTPAN